MRGGMHTRQKPQCSGGSGESPENNGAQRKATPRQVKGAFPDSSSLQQLFHPSAPSVPYLIILNIHCMAPPQSLRHG